MIVVAGDEGVPVIALCLVVSPVMSECLATAVRAVAVCSGISVTGGLAVAIASGISVAVGPAVAVSSQRHGGERKNEAANRMARSFIARILGGSG